VQVGAPVVGGLQERGAQLRIGQLARRQPENGQICGIEGSHERILGPKGKKNMGFGQNQEAGGKFMQKSRVRAL
jgi:hypothetical protein